MKLMTWNCQGAFRKKLDLILAQQPDILVVQECEQPDKLDFGSTIQRPKDYYWYGDNIHKGIGIYSFCDFKLELLTTFNPAFRYILPFLVTGYGYSFTLIAIWARDNKENYKARYIGQVWLAINHYMDLLGKMTILIGDFNSSIIWDYKDRVGNHSDVVRELATKNIHSVYHRNFNVEQGKEKHPTFFLQRKVNKPYHIDYCFASADLLSKVRNVEVGTYEDWIGISDHTPLMIDIDLWASIK
jgi:exodeoxyribonuclease-3